ncbi:MAG: CoA transferase [Deltaproteobacteria bacterium]|nr:CoA transferase [Deltaproteobacteria bacterium]
MSTTPLLDGINVLNLASVGPAARAARTLADYGAGVVQVGPVAKSGSVQIAPPYHTYGAGRGFKHISIDMKSAAGREGFLRLAENSDVIIESFRPGVVDRLGIGYADVSARNPGIVYCSTTGYGQNGPAASWAGHDINYLAMSGFLACTEPRADGGPPIPGATVADSAGGGMHAAMSIMAALVKRNTSGEGSFLDVSATEGVLSLMALSIDQYLATGEVAGPREVLLTGRYAFYDLYPTKDDKWVSVGAIEPKFYANLCNALGLPQYVKSQTDDALQSEIREAFKQVFLTKTRDEWTQALASNDTCVAPVLTIPELVEEPHHAARKIFMQAVHDEHGEFRQVGPILSGGVRDQPTHHVEPIGSSDAPQLLAAAGYDTAEIEKLSAEGTIE